MGTEKVVSDLREKIRWNPLDFFLIVVDRIKIRRYNRHIRQNIHTLSGKWELERLLFLKGEYHYGKDL